MDCVRGRESERDCKVKAEASGEIWRGELQLNLFAVCAMAEQMIKFCKTIQIVLNGKLSFCNEIICKENVT